MCILFYCRWMYILFVHKIFNNNENYWGFYNILFVSV